MNGIIERVRKNLLRSKDESLTIPEGEFNINRFRLAKSDQELFAKAEEIVFSLSSVDGRTGRRVTQEKKGKVVSFPIDGSGQVFFEFREGIDGVLVFFKIPGDKWDHRFRWKPMEAKPSDRIDTYEVAYDGANEFSRRGISVNVRDNQISFTSQKKLTEIIYV